MPLAGPEDTLCWICSIQLNCLPTEPTATTPSFLLLFLCFVREEQICGPELQRDNQPKLAEIANQAQQHILGPISTDKRDVHIPRVFLPRQFGTTGPTGTRLTCAMSDRASGSPQRGPGGALFTTTLSSVGGFFLFLFYVSVSNRPPVMTLRHS